jgi:Ca-activated chloride channel family protein
LTALGFGDRNNDSMMNRVSNAGNGIYSVLFDQDQAIAYAHQRMLSSMIHIAKDMKLQVEFNPKHVRAYRLLGYETRAVADTGFRDDFVDGGEVGAGHRVTALYELVLADGALPAAAGQGSSGDADAAQLTREVGADELVRVKIRYKQPGAAEGSPAKEVSAALAPSQVLAEASAADANTRWAIAVATFAELLAKSPYVDARALPKVRALIEPSVGDDSAKREFLTLFDRVSTLIK